MELLMPTFIFACTAFIVAEINSVAGNSKRANYFRILCLIFVTVTVVLEASPLAQKMHS